jgi:hypothetical protein
MVCSTRFSFTDTLSIFPAAWLRGEYATHRRNVLFNVQRALLATTDRADVDRETDRRDIVQRIQQQNRSNPVLGRAAGPFAGRTRAFSSYREERLWKEEMARLRSALATAGAGGGAAGGAASSHRQHHFAGLRAIPCPAAGCRDFVPFVEGQDPLQCPSCRTDVCPNCLEAKATATATATGDGGGSGTAARQEQQQEQQQQQQHRCDPDALRTLRVIAADSRRCPTCQVPIFRISGCAHMYCTNCNSGFNWGDAARAAAVVSLRRPADVAANAAAPVTAAAPAAASGAGAAAAPAPACPDTIEAALQRLTVARNSANLQRSYPILHVVTELFHAAATVRKPRTFAEDTFRALRVRFLLGDFTEDAWKKKLSAAEREVAWFHANNALIDTLVCTTADAVVRFSEDTSDAAWPRCERFVTETTELCKYLSEQATALSEIYERLPLKFSLDAKCSCTFDRAKVWLDDLQLKIAYARNTPVRRRRRGVRVVGA